MQLSFFTYTSCLCAATIALFAASDAQARILNKRVKHQVPSWYFSLSGSTTFVPDASVTETQAGITTGGELQFDQGYGVAGSIGYRPRGTGGFWDNTRFEVELGTLDSQIDTITANGVGTSVLNGNVQAQRFMFNGFIDFDTGGQFRPYIGGGIGIGRLHAETDEDTVFAYQGIAGITYTPATFPVIEFFSGYRYFGAQDAEFFEQTTGGFVDMEYEAHVLEAGLRAYF